MSLKDIEKLKEKVDKDPNSKLFVPLAEEYRKEGMLDEAIGVLLSGIEKQPGYMSARVALGKIYVEKEMYPEAQSEFEQVIKTIPDNLYAHKKLADIYRMTGKIAPAIKAYKTVLKLNAMDEDALISLSELESLEQHEAETPAPAAQHTPEPVLQTNEALSAPEEDLPPVVGFVEESDDAAAPIKEEDLAAFQSAIFGDTADDHGVAPEDLLKSDIDFDTPEPLAVAEEETEKTEETADAIEEDAFELDLAEETDSADELFAEVPLPAEVVSETAIPELQHAADITLDNSFETAFIATAVAPEMKSVEAAAPLTDMARPAVAGPTLDDADRHVSEANYGSALSVYRAIAAKNPNDRQVLQRMEELRQLLKLMGKDKEAVVEQLNSFLDGIQRKRDEFFGRS